MGYFNDNNYAFTNEELEYGLESFLRHNLDEDSEIYLEDFIDKKIIDNRLLKIVGSADNFIQAKEDIVKIICINMVKKTINNFIYSRPDLSEIEFIGDQKGLVALIKFILKKNNVNVSVNIESNINLLVNNIVSNKSLDTIYERVGVVQNFIHGQVSIVNSIDSMDRKLMYKFLTSVRFFLNFNDIKKLSFNDLILLEKKNLELIKKRRKKEQNIIFDSDERDLDREYFYMKYSNKKYNPRHPVSNNMESFYSFILDRDFKEKMNLILSIDKEDIYNARFYVLLDKIEAIL